MQIKKFDKQYHRSRRKIRQAVADLVEKEIPVGAEITHENVSSTSSSDTLDHDNELSDSLDKSNDDTDSDDDGIGGNIDNEKFRAQLSTWAVKSQCSQEILNDLLILLKNNGHPELPKDSRTLKKTPRVVNLEQKCGGMYRYMGIVNGLKKKVFNNIHEGFIFNLIINTDGIPLFKSSNTQLWPILGMIEGSKPFLISVFCGESKPNNNEEFLEDFLEKYELIKFDGFVYNNFNCTVNVKCFTCDAPARQFLKGVKGHSGYNSCERCTVVGLHVQHRIVFYDMDCEERSDEDFSQYNYPVHQIGTTPLVNSSIKCVSEFALDYMHLVCLGVMRRILLFLKEEPRCCKISSTHVNQISNNMIDFRKSIPSEFARKPRSLQELKRWKATEFRLFVLYTGIIAFKRILDPVYYRHFLSLSIAMNIMLDSCSVKRKEYLGYARKLLKFFVSNAIDLYGPYFNTYNVHNLMHLPDDVERFDGSLDEVSCFPFENHLQTLKRFIKNNQNPISQLTKRLTEQENTECDSTSKALTTKISVSGRDSWFLLYSGNYACVKEERPYD